MGGGWAQAQRSGPNFKFSISKPEAQAQGLTSLIFGKLKVGSSLVVYSEKLMLITGSTQAQEMS